MLQQGKQLQNSVVHNNRFVSTLKLHCKTILHRVLYEIGYAYIFFIKLNEYIFFYY